MTFFNPSRNIIILKQDTLSSYRITFDVTQTPSGSLNGFVIEFLCRRTLTQPQYSIYLISTVGSSIAISNAALGLVDINFAPIDTHNIQPGDYFWECRLTMPSQSVDTRAPASQYGELFLLKSL